MNRTRIEELVDLGYIAKRTRGNLSLYNYTNKTQYESFWCDETLMCRGLILDERDRIVARPFDKFFNWGEGGRTTDARMVNVTAKLDGSLGILYRHADKWHIATRGSFDSDQALWATEWFNTMIPHFPVFPITHLFEIVHPANRVVVDYGTMEDLVLLAIRDNKTGEYAGHGSLVDQSEFFGFRVVSKHEFDTPAAIVEFCATLDTNSEGFVAEFADGQRFKFKGAAYVELHKILSGLTYSRAVETVASGSVEIARQIVPDDLRVQWDAWIAEIEEKVRYIQGEVERAYASAPHDNRKVYALWVQENAQHLAPYLFHRLDGRDYLPLVYRKEFV